MDRRQELIDTARLLIYRLERISPDSIWAHRSSGHRGALLRWVEWMESIPSIEDNAIQESDLEDLQSLIDAGFRLLENAAKEYQR